jgi:4-hydroxy 2-oxovalerate aldolase
MSAVTIVDSTLRDGSHAVRHSFTEQQVRDVTRALVRAGVDVIEVSHGDGLGGSSFNYGFSAVDDVVLVRAAVEEAAPARVAVLLLPGIGVKEDLSRAVEVGATVARVATHCTEADIAISHLRMARELHMTAVGFLMMAHMVEPAVLATQARVMADAGADVVYVTDSAGALVPHAAAARVAALRAELPDTVAVGFHGHQNLSLAVANSLAAVEAGATWIDGCTCGLGAGAGNAPTEALAAAFERSGVETGLDPLALMDVAEDVVQPFLPVGFRVGRSELLLGYAGVYSSFLLHAERAAERFGVSAKEILLEVGRRKAVGGQEDLIIEVAAQLAAATVP